MGERKDERAPNLIWGLLVSVEVPDQVRDCGALKAPLTLTKGVFDNFNPTDPINQGNIETHWC